ncbi:MAG: DUF72 domain-containing protein [Nitrosopumilaceae archaeon]
MEIKIGCTGWSYAGWIGPFYPNSLDAKYHLKHYSGIFDITEVNSTFYRIPSQAMTKKWYNDTPENFIFTAKLPKIITHDNRLKPGPSLDQFLQAITPMKSKMNVIVIQLPPSLSFEEAKEKLDKMLNHLPKSFRYALEGRHESWFSDKVFQYLREKNVCLIWNEVDGVNNPAPITTDFVYLRLIGDRSIPEDQFGKIQKDRTKEMKKWIDILKNTNVPIAYVNLNNHFQGFAPGSVNEFRRLLGLENLSFADKKQKTLGDF